MGFIYFNPNPQQKVVGDCTGRSNHSIKDRMVDSLERMYDEAQTDHERGMLDEWIRKIEASN